MKQIRADRYGNDSRKKGLECVWGLGQGGVGCVCVEGVLHCLTDHQ